MSSGAVIEVFLPVGRSIYISLLQYRVLRTVHGSKLTTLSFTLADDDFRTGAADVLHMPHQLSLHFTPFSEPLGSSGVGSNDLGNPPWL